MNFIMEGGWARGEEVGIFFFCVFVSSSPLPGAQAKGEGGRQNPSFFPSNDTTCSDPFVPDLISKGTSTYLVWCGGGLRFANRWGLLASKDRRHVALVQTVCVN